MELVSLVATIIWNSNYLSFYIYIYIYLDISMKVLIVDLDIFKDTSCQVFEF